MTKLDFDIQTKLEFVWRCVSERFKFVLDFASVRLTLSKLASTFRSPRRITCSLSIVACCLQGALVQHRPRKLTFHFQCRD